MNVRELKDILDRYDDDLPVVFAYPYGDYVGTYVAAAVEDHVESDVVWSEYHRQQKVLQEKYRDDEEPQAIKPALILSGIDLDDYIKEEGRW